MNAIQLLTIKHKPSGIYLCGQCNGFHYAEMSAESCCRCSYCAQPCEPRGYIHPECRAKHEAERHQKLIEKAEKLTSWDGWVFLEGYGSKEGYFPSLSELLESAEFDEVTLPSWVFVCTAQPFPDVSTDDIRCRVEEEGYDGIWDDVSGLKELEAALNAFKKQNVARVSYYPDYSRVVATRSETPTNH